METNHLFKKIFTEENESLQINIVFNENSLDLTVFQNGNAWKSLATQANLEKLSEQHKLCLNDYYTKLIDYFVKTPPNVSFNINKDSEDFIVYCNLGNKIKMKYFISKLQKHGYVECVENLLNEFYTKNLQISERLNNEIKEKTEIKKYKIELESKLNEFIQREKTDKEELYSNFMLILNEKKRQIQHLNELLEAFKAGRPTSNPIVEVKRRKRKKTDKKQSIQNEPDSISESDTNSSSSSNNNYNTDEEKEHVNSTAGPSTSKRNFSFLHDEPTIPLTTITESQFLPKRVKPTIDFLNDDLIENNISSKIIAVTNNNNMGQASSTKEQKVVAETATKDTLNLNESTTIDFSTQDLLDRL